jgi:hypothetical protein
MADKSKKAAPPTVTVKLGVKHPADEVMAWVVRYNGDIVEAYPNTPDGKRAALRHRDSLVATWKYEQRGKAKRAADVTAYVEGALGHPMLPHQKALVEFLQENPTAKIVLPQRGRT